MDKPDSKTRQRILEAALKRFAEFGYAGTSVQDIVDDAQVTKPVLYYYFSSKAGLYQALIDWAHDERFRLMREAAGRVHTLTEQLVEILVALFDFLKEQRALMRLAFGTAFAARGEIPAEVTYLKKCRRNVEFIHSLIRKAVMAGELDKSFSSEQLTMGVYGMISIYVMAYLVEGGHKLNRKTAQDIVRLYLEGAAKKTER
jgi:AcrR family transcriptional regulator